MRAVYRYVQKAEAVLAGVFLLLMVVLIFAGGVARMLGSPINWTIDFATCFFAWAAFLSADIAWRNDALMSIDVLAKRLPAAVGRGLLYLNYLLICCFLAYAVYAGFWLSWVSRSRSFQGIPEISYSWVTASLPVGALLLLVTTLLKVRHAVRRDRAAGGSGAAEADRPC